MPKVGTEQQKFEVTQGTLYRASEHAKTDSGASLVVIDEINRGPAVQIFGGSIVAIESDKRLKPDGSEGPDTHYFELLTPAGKTAEYALPHHLYIVAAMNQADTSVEPLDVAFLRRWAPFVLVPRQELLHHYFDIDPTAPLPDAATESKHVYAAAVQAWTAINDRISLGRGPEYQIGHGVLMSVDPKQIKSIETALIAMGEVWRVIRSHIDEVFFGDVRGIATVLNVREQLGQHIYVLEDRLFGDEPRLAIQGPTPVPEQALYKLLKAVRG